MNAPAKAAHHAAPLYRRPFAAARHELDALESEARRLHQVELEGQSPSTPFLALFGLVLFLMPLFCVVLGLALLAAWIAG
jgi:hypothetical protein